MHKIFVFPLILLFIGCGTSDKTESIKTDTPIVANQTVMQNASSALISGFMSNLKAELMKGVKEGGFANAINICQLKAPKITDNFSTQGWSIKCVTVKPRNIHNQADEHEQQILALFADSIKKLKFFDEWKDVENNKDYYYYKPIYIGKLCLKCHGDETKLDDKAVAALKEKYPEDNAINYNDGDLRGMFVVYINNLDELVNLQQSLQDNL